MPHSRHLNAVIALAAVLLAAAGCMSSTQPTPAAREFIVEVVGERFIVRLTDPETIRLAVDNLQGRNSRFPSGALRSGNGGFNGPWTWHLDPDSVRLVEAAIEVCDGRPSYVETHQADYPTYCPWGGRVIAERIER